MNLTVIGTGHVGLVAGLCFAEIGHQVVCVDSDTTKIDALQQGRLPFFEPHLDDLLERNSKESRLRFTSSLQEGVDHGRVLFLCVGTPPFPTGQPDLSALEQVSRQIACLASSDKLVVEKSTVPALTGTRVEQTLQLYHRGGVEFAVASNPEFLSEGTAVIDFLHPSRTVLGVESERAETLLRDIYEPILRQSFSWRPPSADPQTQREIPLVVTNRSSAELIKHASNSFLAMKISYINAVANLCDQVGGDIKKVAEGMGYDPRIGAKFLGAGIGFGGFCFPKDLQAFVRMAEDNGCDFRLLREVERVNLGQLEIFLEKLRKAMWIVKDKTIAVWGLAFKAQTDDLRFSPAMSVVERLLEEGASVRAYDPQAMPFAAARLPAIELFSSAIEAAEGADAVLLLTDWPEFLELDLERLRQVMTRPLLLDGRNLFAPATVQRAGFDYVAMGRATPAPLRQSVPV